MKILLVGVSVRALAESAKKSGYPIIALDAFGDLDLGSFCEAYSLVRDFNLPFSAKNLLKAGAGLNFDALAYTANLENYPEIVLEFSKKANIIGNSPEVVRRVRDWKTLFSFLRKKDHVVPATFYANDPLPEMISKLWLKKPILGGSGRMINFWKPGNAIRKGYMIQEFIDGLSCSASFIANGDKAVVIGITEQIIGDPNLKGKKFLYRGNLLPLSECLDPVGGPKIVEQVNKLSNELTEEFGLVGFNGFDFILSGENVIITEVNPRYGASMELIELYDDIPVFEWHYRAVMSSKLPSINLDETRFPVRGFIAKSILYADRDGTAPDTSRWQDRGIRDIPHRGETIMRGQPICTVISRGYSRSNCLSNLLDESETLKREIYDRA